MTSFRTIQKRVQRADYQLQFWRAKCVGMRKAVIGDFSDVDENAMPQVDMGVGKERTEQRGDRVRMAYHVMMRDFDAGLSNDLLENIRTLAIKTGHSMPGFEVEGAHDLESVINSLYLKVRLGPAPRGCFALYQLRRSLLHFLIDGCAWVWNTMCDGKPAALNCDSLDIVFDPDVEIWTDQRWRGCYVRRTLGQWVDEFGEGPFRDLLESSTGEEGDVLEKVVELLYYFDAIGMDGTYCVCRADTLGEDDADPIVLDKNPHYHKIDGFRQPFLPIDLIMFLQLPMAPMPIGVAEMMMPHQIMGRMLQRVAQVTALRSTPYWWVIKGGMDDDAKESFARGEPEALIEVKDANSAPKREQGGDVSETIMMLLSAQKKAITAMSGANPYSSGDTVEGTDYASEVNAIQINSGMVEGAVEQELCDLWVRTGERTIWNGMLYDQNPLSLNVDGDVMMFGPRYPIGQVLRGDAELVVMAGSSGFKSKQQEVTEAINFFNFALKAAQWAPGTMPMAIERGLRAFGVRNVAKAMQAPMLPTPGAMGAQDPALGNDAMAAASTQQ